MVPGKLRNRPILWRFTCGDRLSDAEICPPFLGAQGRYAGGEGLPLPKITFHFCFPPHTSSIEASVVSKRSRSLLRPANVSENGSTTTGPVY